MTVFMKTVHESLTLIFTFTFTILSSAFLNMLIALHKFMNQNIYDTNEITYRKRAEPCRIVFLIY